MGKKKKGKSKSGRNAPCPCGSGIKYKKCCLRKTEIAFRKAATRPGSAESEAPEKVDSVEVIESGNWEDESGDFNEFPDEEKQGVENDREEQRKKFWEDFDGAGFKGQVAVIENILDDPALHDKYHMLDLFATLEASVETEGEREIYHALCRRLKAEIPGAYRLARMYLLRDLMVHSLIDGRGDKVEAFFMKIAESACMNIDIFFEAVEHVAYYGDLKLLLEAMRAGWGGVRETDKVTLLAVQEYANLAVDYEIFNYLSETSEPSPSDEALLAGIKNFQEPDPKGLEEYFTCLAGSPGRVWRQDDFYVDAPKVKVRSRKLNKWKGKRNRPKKKYRKELVSEKVFMKNIGCLLNEFQKRFHDEEGAPWPRVGMVRSELSDYFFHRFKGQLVETSKPFEGVMKSGKKQKEPILVFDHDLCPDKATLDVFLRLNYGFLDFRAFKAAAVYESIPAWLRFVESKGLIDIDTREKTFNELKTLLPVMEEILELEVRRQTFPMEQIKKAWISA